MSIFAVFDGHNGIDCVKFICENLVNKIRVHLLGSENGLDVQENFYAYIKKV